VIFADFHFVNIPFHIRTKHLVWRPVRVIAVLPIVVSSMTQSKLGPPVVHARLSIRRKEFSKNFRSIGCTQNVNGILDVPDIEVRCNAYCDQGPRWIHRCVIGSITPSQSKSSNARPRTGTCVFRCPFARLLFRVPRHESLEFVSEMTEPQDEFPSAARMNRFKLLCCHAELTLRRFQMRMQ